MTISSKDASTRDKSEKKNYIHSVAENSLVNFSMNSVHVHFQLMPLDSRNRAMPLINTLKKTNRLYGGSLSIMDYAHSNSYNVYYYE